MQANRSLSFCFGNGGARKGREGVDVDYVPRRTRAPTARLRDARFASGTIESSVSGYINAPPAGVPRPRDITAQSRRIGNLYELLPDVFAREKTPERLRRPLEPSMLSTWVLICPAAA